MMWIVIAFMTAAAVLCVVWPLSKPGRASATPDQDVAFYKQQLGTLDRDIADGVVPAGEAAGVRAEIARRLFAAAERPRLPAGPPRRRFLFIVALAVMLAVPLGSLGLYLRIGSPGAPDMPLASRDAGSAGQDIAAAVSRVETHLAAHPDDGRGFEVLAPLYMRFGRYADAAHAYERALALLGESATRETGYGQALMLQAEGVVTAEAKAAFEKAAAADPTAPQPQFFLGLAAEQDGDAVKARTLWTKLAASAPADASWLPIVRSKLASLDQPTPSPGPGAAPAGAPASPEGAAIANLPADQRMQAIRGMVAGLAARLKESGQDREGWLRLVRAYAVLGDKDKAVDALKDARRNLSGDAQALGQLDDIARQYGLNS